MNKKQVITLCWGITVFVLSILILILDAYSPDYASFGAWLLVVVVISGVVYVFKGKPAWKTFRHIIIAVWIGAIVSYPLLLLDKFLEIKWLAYLFGIPYWVSICYILFDANMKGKLYGGIGKGPYVRFFSGIMVMMVAVCGIIAFFAFQYSTYGIEDTKGQIYYDLRTSIYFSVITFTTLGYGDFRPTETTRGIAALEALLGYVTFGVLIGTFVYFLSSGGKTKASPQKKD